MNARDALPDGGRIEIAVTDVDELLYGRSGEYIRLSVADSGLGIPPEITDKIFEPYFTTKPLNKGTGLGLAMVRSIVEQHAGWVEFDSTPGAGTTFSVYLPQHDRPSEELPNFDSQMAGTPMPKVVGDSQPAVLLVDDEPMILDLARAVLEDGGYRVLTADDGKSALEIAGNHRGEIRLIVLDLTMPGLSGQQTFGKLKTIAPELPVLFSSGYSAEEISDLDGSMGLLSKPYRPKELLLAVAKAIGGERIDDRSTLLPSA